MKIIVITPIKNEAWILERFLTVTSQFADHIIIADQNSSDGSREICMQYNKVTLIDNEDDNYDEAKRQILLLKKARELVDEPKIILALDADEILAANAMETIGWKTMLKAKQGTVLFFEKPDLYMSPNLCIRFRDNLWPLGFVDDGGEHIPKTIHSIRVPVKDDSNFLLLNDIVVLHYAPTRQNCQRAKFRMYSVIENIKKTNPIHLRRKRYSLKNFMKYNREIELSQPIWFEKWEKLGIDMQTISDNKIYWNDYKVLELFKEYGTKKFWFDDIWDQDWVSVKKAYSKHDNNFHEVKIIPPPYLLKKLLKLVDRFLL